MFKTPLTFAIGALIGAGISAFVHQRSELQTLETHAAMDLHKANFRLETLLGQGPELLQVVLEGDICAERDALATYTDGPFALPPEAHDQVLAKTKSLIGDRCDRPAP